MCGVAGLFDFTGKLDLKSNKIEEALEFIKYRGPDESHYIEADDYFCGGAVRLSIEALEFGKQPISDSRYTIGFNGEIFNYKNLAKNYGLPSSSSTSEVQFLLEAWPLKGPSLFADLEGQFAIFIYDTINRKLVLGRDPYGIRPLFFSFTNKLFSFCSEIKGLSRLSRTDFSFDTIGIAQIAMYWATVGDRTVFDNVKQVKRGHFMIVTDGNVEQFPYWQEPLLNEAGGEFKTRMEAEEFLRHSLESSIKLQTHGEVGFSSYLSGGIDSSALAFFLNQYNSQNKLQTFSIGFENKEYDESLAQREMIDFLGVDHTSIMIGHKDISSNFRKVIEHAETILFRTAPVPLYLLSKKVKEAGQKVVFTGEGADEILLGYDLFAEARIRKFWAKNPGSNCRPMLLTKLYSYLPQFRNSRYFSIIKDFYLSSLSKTDHIFYSHFVRWAQFKQVSAYFNFGISEEALEETLVSELISSLPHEFGKGTPDRKAQILEFETLLHGYLLSSQGDRMSMANSVEGRYPFLGQKFVKDMAKILDSQKTIGIQSKSLFRKTMSNLLPASVTNRPKVAYQAPEAKSFLSSSYKTEESMFLNEVAPALDVLNHQNLKNLNEKISNEFSSDRLGFRENMAYIMSMSAAHLSDISKGWNEK